MAQFSIEFPYQGKRQSVTIHAADWPDAERKLWMLKGHGEIAGRVVAEISIAPRVVGLWGWLRSLLGNRA